MLYLTWLPNSWRMTHRIPITLQLTVKYCLTLNFLCVFSCRFIQLNLHCNKFSFTILFAVLTDLMNTNLCQQLLRFYILQSTAKNCLIGGLSLWCKSNSFPVQGSYQLILEICGVPIAEDWQKVPRCIAWYFKLLCFPVPPFVQHKVKRRSFRLNGTTSSSSW